METNNIPNESKAVKVKYASTMVIRVHKETAKTIRKELNKLNKKDFGKRVLVDDIISLAISKLTDDDRARLQNKTLSNSDRIEMLYRDQLRNGQAMSKEDFLGKLLDTSASQLKG
jgi:hypothetical protein